jgi:hypothetical protein
MVNTQRPDDAFLSEEPDTEGHTRLSIADDEAGDTEGHTRLSIADEDDDTEGHTRLS